MDGVEKAFGFVIDFGDDSSARGPDPVSFERPLQRNLLTGEEFFRHTKHTTIAADKQGMRDEATHQARAIHPGSLENYAERYAIALPQAFCACSGHEREKHRLNNSLATGKEALSGQVARLS